MNSEPSVARAIKRYRWKAGLIRIFSISALLVLCALILSLVIVPFATGNTTFSPLVRKTGGSITLTVAIVLGAVLVVAAFVLYLPGISRDRRMFAALTVAARGFDARRLGGFMSALGSLSQSSEAGFPRLRVINGDQPNAVTFDGEDGPVVGITRGLLELDLPEKEVEAIMAHELAGIIVADYLERPGATTFESSVYFLLFVFAALAVVAVPMTVTGRGRFAAFLVACVLLGFLFLGSLSLRRLRDARGHDDLLIDSIAARLTGDPDALEASIRKLDGLVNGTARRPMPDSEIGLDYMFIRPYRWGETPEAFLHRQVRELHLKWSETTIESRADSMRSEMDRLAEKHGGRIEERLENLESMECGRWSTLERGRKKTPIE